METAEQLGASPSWRQVRRCRAGAGGGRNSVELCGGTHVRALGDIGQFRIVSEGSIGSNIRRIEALTGTASLELAREAEQTVAQAAEKLGIKNKNELLEMAESRMAEISSLKNELAQIKQQIAVGQAPQLAAQAVDGVVVARVDDLSATVFAISPCRSATRKACTQWRWLVRSPGVRGRTRFCCHARLAAQCRCAHRRCQEDRRRRRQTGRRPCGRRRQACRADRRRTRSGPGGRWDRLMRALGLDLGQKRVGVAVSDSAGALAMPIEVLSRLGDRPREHRAIAELVEEWEAEIVVVGLPYNMDGSAGPMAKKYAAEAKVLGDTLSVPVVLYDERLTTVSAERALMDQNMNTQDRRQVVDKVAASVMLQSWLDAGMPQDGRSSGGERVVNDQQPPKKKRSLGTFLTGAVDDEPTPPPTPPRVSGRPCIRRRAHDVPSPVWRDRVGSTAAGGGPAQLTDPSGQPFVPMALPDHQAPPGQCWSPGRRAGRRVCA